MIAQLFVSALMVVSTGGDETAIDEAYEQPVQSNTSIDVTKYRTLALMPLSSLGSTDESVNAIASILVSEFEKILGLRLVKPDRLKTLGRHVNTAFQTCEGEIGCLTEIIGGLGWDGLIVGNIAGLGDNRVIKLKLIDVRSGREVRRVSERAVGDPSELIAFMRKAAVELVAPDLYTGTIEILASQPDVTVLIDAKLVGITPLANNQVQVLAGSHAIEATGPGLVPFASMVQVAYGETKKVTVELPTSGVFLGGDTPFRHRFWTWAIAGLGGVALGLGGYFNYLHADQINKIEKRAAENGLASDNTDLYSAEKAHWKKAVACYWTGGVLLGGVGVLFTLDMF